MFVRGSIRSANYTGDCRLSQAYSVYDQELAKGLITTEHVLVAPHHGGDYGSQSRLYSNPCNYIEISVGSNSYGHPDPVMEHYLGSLGTVEKTIIIGDIKKDL